MNLFHKKLQLNFPFCGISRALHFCALSLPLILLSFTSCIDEKILPDSPSPSPSSSVTLVDLPGVLGINIGQSDGISTRADDSTTTSDGKTLSDGLASEYDLASPEGDEKYHYLLLYDKADINAKPLVFPIDASNQKNDPDHINNLTLTISQLFVSRESDDLNGNTFISDFTSLDAMKNYMKNTQGYVLLNFKLDDNYQGTLTGNNTVEKLSNLKRSQLENLEMKDYKVNASYSTTSDEDVVTGKKDYFTMSSSVYSNGTARVVDYNIDTNKIFNNEEQALANPAIVVHVERLAAKYTVKFDLASMAAVGNNFGPDDKQVVKSVEENIDGLPVISMDVSVVDMSHPGGITFSTDGYNIETRSLPAKLKIIGYGVSNVEQSQLLVKDINGSTSTTSWKWNDAELFRCYWTKDTHYEFRPGNGNFTRVQGYPHQFRLALDADTVTSYHNGLGGENGYIYSGKRKDEYTIGESSTTYESYNQLGEIDMNQLIGGVNLKYKSFNELMEEFKGLEPNPSYTTDRYLYYSEDPIYSLENTYFDQAMVTAGTDFIWKWQRAPYAAATNLIVMAQIEIEGNTDSPASSGSGDTGNGGNSDSGEIMQQSSKGLKLKTREAENASEETSVRTVYLGQNNIFYLYKRNLLNSKLAILNQVMLSGGNAGLQILHGLWDQHARWGGDEPAGSIDSDQTHLDKVAWNEGSKLWFGKLEEENGEPKYTNLDEDGEEITDKDGNPVYVPVFEELRLASVDKHDSQRDQTDDDLDLDLIPAEISGGDGQCLIAPGPNRMGKFWKYYLAPDKEVTTTVTENDPETGEEKTTTVTTRTMDMSQAVEINYNHLVALIHKIIGPVDVYTNGYMYFSVPVPHRYQTNGDPAAWTHIGAYSVVRNNWYDILVQKITRMGTPVHVPGQPIVPVMDVKRSYINMGVKLLNWHNITQDNIPMM